VQRLDDARIRAAKGGRGGQVWVEVRHIVRRVQTMAHRHHTIRDRLVDATVKPGTGKPRGVWSFLFALFWLVAFLIGEGLIRYGVKPVLICNRVPINVLSGWTCVPISPYRSGGQFS